MRRISIPRAGSYDRLQLETTPDPVPRAGEVLVRTTAIGVNYADCLVRMGLYASAKEYVGWPITPGFEVAGVVDAVGEGVHDLAVGARVMALTRFGGYATHVVLPRDQVFAVPSGFDDAQAAGFPAVALTAYYALFDLANVRAGWKVLVHSAGGGVGCALVQLARIAGCEVVGVVGTSAKVATVQKLGAAHVIDKSKDDLWREARRLAPKGYDVVLDANGVETLGESYKHLASPGRLVVYGFHTMMPREGGRPRWGKLAADYVRTPRFNPLDMTNENRSVLAFNLSYLFEQKHVMTDALTRMSAWIAEGKLVSAPVTTFPLGRVADAHRAIESGTTVGKLVLLPSR
jgi:NADPH:quinone reductase-like Zn-dependent oxidoreductase